MLRSCTQATPAIRFLKLVKESVSEYHCMTLPFVDDDTINMYNIDMAEQKEYLLINMSLKMILMTMLLSGLVKKILVYI